MKYWVLFFAIVFGFSSMNAYPQNNTGSAYQSQILIDVTRNLTVLKVNLQNRNYSGNDSLVLEKIKQKTNEISYSLSRLINDCLEKSTKSDVSLEILKEAYNYNSLLIWGKELKNVDSVYKLMSFISDDLKTKFSGSLGSESNDKTDLVEVKVRVLDNLNKELPGYFAFVKPEWSLNPDQVEAYNPTNNAKKKIIPGLKIFWIEKKGIKVSQRPVAIYLGSNPPVDFIINTSNK